MDFKGNIFLTRGHEVYYPRLIACSEISVMSTDFGKNYHESQSCSDLLALRI